MRSLRNLFKDYTGVVVEGAADTMDHFKSLYRIYKEEGLGEAIDFDVEMTDLRNQGRGRTFLYKDED